MGSGNPARRRRALPNPKFQNTNFNLGENRARLRSRRLYSEFVVPYSTVVPLLSASGLWLVLSVKHFLADFVLQTSALARGKEQAQGWFVPLAVHAGEHGLLTLLIALAVSPRLWPLGIVDFVIHFLVDRGKSVVGRWGGWSLQDPQYWWLFGFDQFLHQATNVGLAVVLLAG
jgi:Protein of unknown function (DUF3307)